MLATMNPNGAQPRNDSFDVLTIANPSPTPFEVYYGSELHAIIQPQKAIQLVKLIAGDSNHGAIKHLIDRMCRLNGKPKNEPSVRAAWYSKIVINQKVSHMPTLPTILDQAREINRELAQNPVAAAVQTTPNLPTPTQPIDANGFPKTNPAWKFDPLTGAPLAAPKTVITPESVDISHIEIQSAEQTLPTVAGIAPTAPLPPHPNPEANDLLNGIRRTDSDDGKVIGEVPAEDEPATVEPPKRTETPTKEQLIEYARDVMFMNIDDPKTRLELEKQDVSQLMDTLKYDIYA
jgi:hypothetical protein